jgi:hypothetical protein
MKYEAVPKLLWSTLKVKPLGPEAIDALVIQRSDHGCIAIMDCTTLEDAKLAVLGLLGHDIEVREKPNLTDTYMASKEFAEALLPFLGTTAGARLKKMILGKFA